MERNAVKSVAIDIIRNRLDEEIKRTVKSNKKKIKYNTELPKNFLIKRGKSTYII